MPRRIDLKSARKALLFAACFSSVALLLVYNANNNARSPGGAAAVVGSLSDFLSALSKRMYDFEPSTSRNVEDIRLLLWTRENREEAVEASVGSSPWTPLEPLNRSLPTKVLFHGFSDNGKTSWILRFKDTYLDVADANVISVSWEPLCRSPWYSTAAKNAELVGLEAAKKLKGEGVPPESVHAIGSSLGAQAAASFAYHCGGRISRLTGLDPSGPGFHGVHHSLRLDPSDAEFVDVIHTAGKWVGTDEAVGHADFFPNSGRAHQPGCSDKESVDLTCSHLRAWQFFVATIKGKEKFKALKCDSYQEFKDGGCCESAKGSGGDRTAFMGEHVNRSSRGSFYLDTSDSSPYSKELECDLTE